MLKKTLFAAVSIALLASPLVASASTLSDLETQLQSLLQELDAIQMSQPAAAATAVTATTTPTGTLSVTGCTTSVAGGTCPVTFSYVTQNTLNDTGVGPRSQVNVNNGSTLLSSFPNTTSNSASISVPLPEGSYAFDLYGLNGASWVLLQKETVGVSGPTTTNSLVISVDPTFAGGTVEPGATGVVMGSFDLDATHSNEDVRLNNLPLTIGNTSGSVPSGSISDCQLFSGTTALNTTALNPTSVSGANYTITFTNPLTIAKGTVQTLTLKCNIASDASGVYAWNINTAVLGSSVGATGVTDGAAIPTTLVGGGTHSITIGTASLIAVVPVPASYAVVTGGTTGVAVGNFTLQPSPDPVTLHQIGLTLNANYASSSDIANASIYNSSGTLVGSAIFAGSPVNGYYYATSTVSSMNLPQNTQTNFVIKVNVSQIGIGQAGTSGHMILINLADAQATDNTTGAVVNSGSIPALPGTGVRIFRSYPTVAQGVFSVAGFSSGQLMRFNITASPNGPIGIDQLAFFLSGINITGVSNLGLYAYSDSGYSQPISGAAAGGLVGAVMPNAPMNTRFSVSAGAKPLEIPAGTTAYFELHGTIAGSGNEALNTTLYGDSSFNGMGSAGNSSLGNFIWSPNSTTTSLTSSNDWTNGFGISGLPAIGITQIITGSSTTTVGVTSSATMNIAPVISGTANGTSVVDVKILYPAIPVASSTPIYDSGKISVVNGKYSVTPAFSLPSMNGGYYVEVFDGSGNLLQSTELTLAQKG